MTTKVNGNAVGYKNPPKHSRYQKGFSGNPRGRPKGGQTAVSILQEVFRQTVQITENNTTRKITKAEALIKVIVVEAIKGTRQYADVMVTICDLIGRIADNPKVLRGGIVLMPGMANSSEEFEETLRQHREQLEREDEMLRIQKAAEMGRTNMSETGKLPPRKLTRRTTSSPSTV